MQGSVAVHCTSSIGHCPHALWWCIAGILLPTTPQEVPLCIARVPLATGHHAMWRCIAGVPLPSAPQKSRCALQEFQWPLHASTVALH